MSYDTDTVLEQLSESDFRKIFKRLGFDGIEEKNPGSEGWIGKLHGPTELGEGSKGNFAVNIQHGGVCDHGDEGYSGSLFDAVSDVKGLSFPKAVQWVASESDLELFETEEQPWDWEDGQVSAKYEYHDENGDHHVTIIRKEPPPNLGNPASEKKFRPYVEGEGFGMHGRAKIPYRLPDFSAQTEGGPKLVAYFEGEKDSDNAWSLGIPATTTPFGANSFDAAAAVPHFDELVVAIFPDNDSAGEKHAQQVAEALSGTAEAVKIVRLDDRPEDGGDVSDWIEQKWNEGLSDEEIGDLLEEKIEEAPTYSPQEDGQTKDEESNETLSWAKVKALYEDDKRKARLKAALLAIRELNLITIRRSENLFVYDSDAMVYDEKGNQALKELLVRKLGPYHSNHEVSEIRAKVKALTYHPQFGADPVIPLANGDLSLNPLELLDASPERPFLVRSPARWDPEAESPIFDKYLRKAVPSERHRLTLQEYIGYCLLHWDLPLHKALFLVGPTASGKSTLLYIVCKLLAKIATVSPQGLVDNRFKSSELEGAWANIRSDISSELMKNIGLFKELTAGDQIYVEEKHQQGYTIEPTAKHIYSANQLPSISTDDDAFYRRILLIPFPTTVPADERDPKLPQRLEKELDGILQWAVEGLLRLIEQEGFTCDPGPKETRRKWEEHGSSIGQFKAAKLRVTGDSEDVEPKQEVHSAYVAFCKENGLSTETQQELTRSLKRDPQITDAKRTPEDGGRQVRSFIGVQIQ